MTTLPPAAAGPLRAPFPYHGGKSRAASLVWAALGDPIHYVEPFAGSAAVLLARDAVGERTETLNDADGFVVNFFRAMRSDPTAVARHCEWPVSELDQYARHRWLVARRPDIEARLAEDPCFYDACVAGWWAWGLCCWIGDGWCAPAPARVKRKLPKIDGAGGVLRAAVARQAPELYAAGRGVLRRRYGRGVGDEVVAFASLAAWLAALAARLRHVRMVCGDWTRVVSESALFGPLATGARLDARDAHAAVFFDPPYAGGQVRYAKGTGATIQADVAAWCRDRAGDRRLRIVLAGQAGEYDLPGWTQVPWKRKGGGELSGHDQHAERLWLSPTCARATAQRGLFDADGAA